MYKPILVKSNYCGDIGRYVDSNKLIFRNKNDLPRGEDVDIIIIDTEAKIVKYDWVYDKTSEELVYQVDTEPIPKEYPWFKIISSNNKYHTVDLGHKCLDVLPQLSNASKLLFIDYYNKHKRMPESVDYRIIDNGDEDWQGDDVTGQPIWIEKLEIDIITPKTDFKSNLEEYKLLLKSLPKVELKETVELIDKLEKTKVEETIPENKLRGDFLDAANELFESKIVSKVEKKSIKDCVASHEGDTQYEEEKTYTEEEVETFLFEFAATIQPSYKRKLTKEWFNSKKK